jgi:hypothetical protein
MTALNFRPGREFHWTTRIALARRILLEVGDFVSRAPGVAAAPISMRGAPIQRLDLTLGWMLVWRI